MPRSTILGEEERYGGNARMENERGRNRKRGRQSPKDRRAWSCVLREIGTAIQRRQHKSGLSRIEEELRQRKDIVEQARLLALAGDSECKRGAYEAAAAIYLKCSQRTMNHPREWFRGLLGCVRALLKAQKIDEAKMVAQHALAMAQQRSAAYESVVEGADEAMMRWGAVQAPAAPWRVSVVATRLGSAFLEEGELEEAERLFRSALEVNGGEGACRARIGLARLALMRGDAEAALRGAEEAIRQGRYRRKTVAAWEVLIAARRALGGWQIKESLLRGLASAPAGVRARAVLTIVREMARHGMRQGWTVAELWLAEEGARDPVTAAELLKLRLAQTRREHGAEAEACAIAERLLATAKLDRTEWWTAVKTQWVAALRRGERVEIQRRLEEAEKKYGRTLALRAAHSMALVLMEWRRHDEARELLQRIVQNAPCGSAAWATAVWTWARMERALGRYAEAAQGYRRYYEEEKLPKRFRLQARLLWAQMLAASGQSKALEAARSELNDVLRDIGDPVLLMNFARHLLVASPAMDHWARDVFERGKKRAIEQFESAGHPAIAIDLLFQVTRRQVCDFGETEEVIRFWEDLSSEKKGWMWSRKEAFWEYLGWVLEAYIREGRNESAEAFAQQWLEDAATPPIGVVHVGHVYGRWLVQRGELAQALLWFERMVLVEPRHPLCGLAWYWKALRAARDGHKDERDRCLRSLREAQGPRPSLWYEWALDAKSLLLLADLDIGRAAAESARYRREDWERLRKEILCEMGALK